MPPAAAVGWADPSNAPPRQQRTGGVVPTWGKGPGAAAILGTTDHTDLFRVLQGRPSYRP